MSSGLGPRQLATKVSAAPPRQVPAHLNVVEQFVAATEAAGIGHGFYYSLTNNFYLNVAGHTARPKSTALPGQAPVSQEEFEALALAQVSELWRNYGDLTEIWLDGGCGAMCDKVGALVRTSAAGGTAIRLPRSPAAPSISQVALCHAAAPRLATQLAPSCFGGDCAWQRKPPVQ